MVNKSTGNKQGDGEGHGCFHTNFDISENVFELCLNDLSQVGAQGVQSRQSFNSDSSENAAD